MAEFLCNQIHILRQGKGSVISQIQFARLLRKPNKWGKVRVAAEQGEKVTDRVQYWFYMCSRNWVSKVKHESETKSGFQKASSRLEHK